MEAPEPSLSVSPDTSAFFHRAGSAPEPRRKKHFGEGHTVKPNQLTRVLPRHAGRDSHITTLCLVWFYFVAFPLTPSPYSDLSPNQIGSVQMCTELAELAELNQTARCVFNETPCIQRTRRNQENATLEATLGIEGTTRRTNALRSKPMASLWTPKGHQ